MKATQHSADWKRNRKLRLAILPPSKTPKRLPPPNAPCPFYASSSTIAEKTPPSPTRPVRLPRRKSICWRAWIALESGERELLLPVSADACNRRSCPPLQCAHDLRFRRVRAVWLNLLAEQSPLQFALWTDGICFAIRAISALTDFPAFPQWRSAMPRISRTNRRVAIPTERAGSVLRAFAESEPSAEFGGGVRFRHGRDWAGGLSRRISP